MLNSTADKSDKGNVEISQKKTNCVDTNIAA